MALIITELIDRLHNSLAAERIQYDPGAEPLIDRPVAPTPEKLRQHQEERAEIREIAHFMTRADFEIEVLLAGISAKSNAPIWQEITPLFIWLVMSKPFNSEEITSLYQAMKNYYGENLQGRIVIIVIDRQPGVGELHNIFAIYHDKGLRVIPLPHALISQARIENRERYYLHQQVSLYLGHNDLYAVNTAVTDVLSFFGRSQLLARLQRKLTEGTSIIVYGVRKIGKSSLMGRLRGESNWPVATVNLQGHFGSIRDICEDASQQWYANIRVNYPDISLPTSNDLGLGSTDFSAPGEDMAIVGSAFRKTVKNLLAQLLNKPNSPGLLLFLDEMDELLSHPNYYELASLLRNIAEDPDCKGRISIMMLGLDPMLSRLDSIEGKRNPLFNFFQQEPLGMLESDDTRTMIVSLGNQMGVSYDQQALGFLVNIGGGHAFLTRQLCSQIIRDKSRPIQVSWKDAKYVVESYLVAPHNYLEESLWALDEGGPSSEEAGILQEISRTNGPTKKENIIPSESSLLSQRAYLKAFERLEDQSLIQSTKDGWVLTIPLYQIWIRRWILGLADEVEGYDA
jgi:hypothetical protein